MQDHYLYCYGILTSNKGISPIDCEFLLNNLLFYAVKRCRQNSGYDKDHCASQMRKIYDIFDKFGIPEEMVKDAMPFRNRKELVRIICDRSSKQ